MRSGGGVCEMRMIVHVRNNKKKRTLLGVKKECGRPARTRSSSGRDAGRTRRRKLYVHERAKGVWCGGSDASIVMVQGAVVNTKERSDDGRDERPPRVRGCWSPHGRNRHGVWVYTAMLCTVEDGVGHVTSRPDRYCT